MPVYEYECKECGNVMSFILWITDRDKHVGDYCSCGGPLRRSVGCNGFILKGNCWEKDGYATHLGDTPAFKGVKWAK